MHTPGPWRYSGTAIDGYSWIVHLPDRDEECGRRRITVEGFTSAEADANARLIAAAPELLAACQAFAQLGFPYDYDLGDVTPDYDVALKLAAAAIAKADGH